MRHFCLLRKRGKKLLTLTGMLRADRDGLICDLAETYGVFDMKALPIQTVAALAAGLREESRIKMHLTGRKATRVETLLAAVLDGVNRITWLLSAVCPHEGEGPKSVLRAILGQEGPQGNEAATVFTSPEDFERTWAQLTGVEHGTE